MDFIKSFYEAIRLATASRLWLWEMLHAVLAAVLVTLAAAVIRLVVRKRKGIPNKPWRETALLLTVLYATAVLALVWLPLNFLTGAFHAWIYGTDFPVEFWKIPNFGEIFDTFPALFLPARYQTFEFYANILLFLPFGVLLPLVVPGLRKFAGFLACLGGAALLLELGQLFVPGRSFDWGDVLAYLLGGLTGYPLFLGFRRLFPKAAATIGK